MQRKIPSCVCVTVIVSFFCLFDSCSFSFVLFLPSFPVTDSGMSFAGRLLRLGAGFSRTNSLPFSQRTKLFSRQLLSSNLHRSMFSLANPIRSEASTKSKSLGNVAVLPDQLLLNVQKRFVCGKKPWIKPYKLKSHRSQFFGETRDHN